MFHDIDLGGVLVSPFLSATHMARRFYAPPILIKHPFRNDEYRYGSAAFAGRKELQRAGMFRKIPQALFVGFFEVRALWYNGDGGLLMIAGARTGKLRDILAITSAPAFCRTRRS